MRADYIKVPAQVLKGIEFVRCSGLTNMFVIKQVQKVASDNGYCAAVIWIENNKKAYIDGILKGFKIDLMLSLAEEGSIDE